MGNDYQDQLNYLASVLPDWYERNARKLPWRVDREPYHIWLSEIMLQQTRVEAATGYYKRFLNALPTVQSLADADEELLLKLWEGLGYYNRARNLQKAAQRICEDCNGVFPSEYEKILALPGIGPYTAGAIASICFELPTPAVDGNVLRALSRYLADPSVIDEQTTKNKTAQRLKPFYREGRCGVFTQALMELGACVCVPVGAPRCARCPVRSHCSAFLHNSWDQFPVRADKRPRKRRRMLVLVLRSGDAYAIRKRPATGLLASLWEFPNTDAPCCGSDAEVPGASSAVAFAQSLGVQPTEIEKEISYTHIFTHVEWEMTAYYMTCANRCDELVWAQKERLERDYALPSAFKPFFDAI